MVPVFTEAAIAEDNYVYTNGVKLHYIEYPSEGPVVLLMHGLTANAHAFDGLVAAGLLKYCNLISVDLRGRGLSDQPEDYSIAAHAEDIIGLMDYLQLDKIIVGGHSFGGLLSIYLAANYPERISKVILLDAGGKMHPKTREMLMPAMSRLGVTFPSFSNYLTKVKSASYNTFWDDSMLSYYQADVVENEDGTVTPRSKVEHIGAAAMSVLSEPWNEYLSSIYQPAILINGVCNYVLDAPLLPPGNAVFAAEEMKHCRYAAVMGNHQTMLYGDGARQIVATINSFVHYE